MKTEQLEKLLLLYKQAVANNITAGEFATEIQAAKIELDKSFVKDGKEDMNLGEYIEELYLLQTAVSHE